MLRGIFRIPPDDYRLFNDPKRGNQVSHGLRGKMARRYNSLPVPPDFNDQTARRRVRSSALVLFRKIMNAWHVPSDESRRLLAVAPEAKLDDLDPEELSEEQMIRISFIIGIYKALHIVHGDSMADEWIRLPNTNSMFRGEVPMKYMIRGGLEALQKVRRHLDGRTQGH